MLVLHVHWIPPHKPVDPGRVLFWAETSTAVPPEKYHRRRRKNSPPRGHPFCAPLAALQAVFGQHGATGSAVLRLPTTRSRPLPSPELIYEWDPDRDKPRALVPWTVNGIELSPAQAALVLIRMPSLAQVDEDPAKHLVPAADACFWQNVVSLVFETLASQKLAPVLASTGGVRQETHARWLPVLDGPRDSERLTRLAAAMPPVCRAGGNGSALAVSPRALLDSFLNTVCDALARRWGKSAGAHLSDYEPGPAIRWLSALFADDPAVKASPGQIQSLAGSHRAWMRSLEMAGDPTYRIAFRLESPSEAVEASQPAWQLHYLLQARDDPSLLVPAETVWKTRGSVLKRVNRRFAQPQEKLLTGLGYSARLFPPISDSLKEKSPTHLNLDSQAAYTFLREAAPLLEQAGFGLLVPPWWNKPGSRLGARLRLRPAGKKGEAATTKGLLTMDRLVNYEWQLSIGETALTEEEFRALAALKSPLVQIRGQWVQLDPDQIEAAIQFWEKRRLEGQMDILEALQILMGDQGAKNGLPVDEVIPEGELSTWLEQLSQSEKLVELPQPAGLQGKLRPYQLYGFSWLHFHKRWGLGACLADDMGLGKTIQTLAMLLAEKEAQGSLPGPALLVCPTSVVTNWEREVRRFAPSLTTLIHQGPGRLRGEALVSAAQSVDMVLTSYALVRQDAETLQSIPWLGVVLDEAQNIKNPSARQTQAARQLPAGFRLALTGTPVENRLSELWSIMHFLNPGYLGSRQAFRSRFGLPIERYNDQDALHQLKQLVGPFILRRVKTDPTVIQDLPEKVETRVYCNLSEEQATLYEAVVQETMQQIEQKEGIERRGQVLSLLMQLKQICNHPVQYLHQVGQASEDDLERSGMFSETARSGKLERLVELLDELLAEGDRALIFTQFAEMGKLLAGYLPRSLGCPVLFLHGGTPPKARDQMVQRFQEEEHAPPVFILSLKAGGTGINLTRANHVFHFDRWWNPAVENQATDRAFRIGQWRSVQVHKFVTLGTLEEMIDDLIESKKGLAQAVVGSGENWLTELSTDELREMVKYRRQ